MSRIKTFRVQDTNGIKFTVFRRERIEPAGAEGQSRKYLQFELESGEPGRFVDEDTFELTASGERMSRVHRTRRVSHLSHRS